MTDSNNGPVRFRGREYANLAAMPPDERREYERLAELYTDADGNGVPDVLEPRMRYVSAKPPAMRRVLGCFSGCAFSGLLGMLLLVAAIYGGVVWLFRSSESYDIAFARLRASPEVVAVFGEPIEPGWWVLGQISSGGGMSRVSYQMPISGPLQSGTVSVSGSGGDGEWALSVRVSYERDGKRHTINLSR
ncbi:MAG TPA: cytochrome c oxidase assembly factor Coa1 family protein [Herpetosiphonaceae bacterium]